MGIDACIYVKTRDGEAPELCNKLSDGCSIKSTNAAWAPEGATHEVDQMWRYYGEGYERGPWPDIAATLMALIAGSNVESVWYYGDVHETDDPITPEQVLTLCAHYMKVGDRPYRKSIMSR